VKQVEAGPGGEVGLTFAHTERLVGGARQVCLLRLSFAEPHGRGFVNCYNYIIIVIYGIL
jgi:hypothetical protein